MMDKVATSFLDNVCRLCTGKTDGVSIYSEEGKRHGLRDKIRKFLAIDVTEEDVLPKMVCSVCTSKLDGMDEFASMAAQTQAKLLECIGGLVDVAEDVEGLGGDWTTPQLEGLEDRLNTEKRHRLLPPLTENGAAVVDEPNNGEDMQGSLLHSILTKGQNQSSEVVESTGGVTELEVRVDPMLFLCDQEDMEEPPSVNNNNNHSNDDSPPSPRTSTSDESTANSSDPERDAPRLALESKMRQCGLCPRSFYTELSLQSHMWQHVPFATARKMIVPPEQNGFQMHTNLYRHKLYHSSSQCLCQVCGRVYPTRSTLRAHQITHSNLRPHKCSLCDKTFKRNQDLKFHINQHTGERPYRCPYCPKAFASSGNCFSHRKRMHPKQLARDKNKLLSTRH